MLLAFKLCCIKSMIGKEGDLIKQSHGKTLNELMLINQLSIFILPEILNGHVFFFTTICCVLRIPSNGKIF